MGDGTSRSAAGVAREYARRLGALLHDLDVEAVQAVAELIEEARRRGRTVFILGNGGSAATATHITQDLRLGTRGGGRPGVRVVGLTDNVSCITALGNDRAYAEIFAGQLEGMVQPGDVVLAISASGNSPNVLQAVRYANEAGATTVAFTGFDGGALRTLARLCVHIQSEPGEYGPVEDMHLVLGHILTTYLKARALAEERPPA